MRRLIIVPQLPISMRYQEWWPDEIRRSMIHAFDEVKILGACDPQSCWDPGEWSVPVAACENEARQIQQYMAMDITKDDVLFHCDLSFPGLFHNVLFHKRPGRAYVICHATSINNHDLFSLQRLAKWPIEQACALLYDKVLVATKYHDRKLSFNVRDTVVMGALPHPPARILPPAPTRANVRLRHFVSVARPTLQKVDQRVETELYKLTGHDVQRGTFETWSGYYIFLDHAKYLIITAKEETYGYQVVDAILRGCCPIAPRAFSYPELLPDTLLYDPSGSPAERAQEIAEIAEREPECPRLLCEDAAQGFWAKLEQVLTE